MRLKIAVSAVRFRPWPPFSSANSTKLDPAAMLTELVLRYGYLMVFVGVLVEGDATLVAASFLAHRGELALSAVMAIAAVTSVTMNQVYFRLGRRHGIERVAKADG